MRQSVGVIFGYLVSKQLQFCSEEESLNKFSDSSSSMDMSTHMSSSLDWSQPVTRGEESLELKWDDDDDENKSDDDDKSQRPLEMKVNPTNSTEQPIDGKLCCDLGLAFAVLSSYR
jgi:hypothetical protein